MSRDEEVKRCSRCHVAQSVTEFHRHTGRPDGRQTYCKGCKSDYTKDWYQRNLEKHREATRSRGAMQQTRNNAAMAEMYDQPCVECGERFHPAAMDFDHVRGTKLQDVSRMRNLARDRLFAEIAKCEVVCANCHRRRTVRRRLRDRVVEQHGWWVPGGSNPEPAD